MASKTKPRAERVVRFKAWAARWDPRRRGAGRFIREEGWPQMPDLAAWKEYFNQHRYVGAAAVRVLVTVRVLPARRRRGK